MILTGNSLDVLKTLDGGVVHTCITAPPYWGLRDYGMDGQLGQESTPSEYVSNLTEIFREVRRVLRDDGTLWLNLGDTYAGTGHKGDHTDPKNRDGRTGQAHAVNNKIEGLKPKDLVGIPWRVAFALQDDGWYLRQDIIWHKPNAMPSPVKDRPTTAHEYLFLLSKSRKYYYNHEAIKEPCSPENVEDFKRRKTTNNKAGDYAQERPDLARDRSEYMPADFKRNKRSVWDINTKPFKGAHFATWPEALVKPCVLAGCPEGGTVLDPFSGSGTTGIVANKCGAKYIGIEINPEYVEMSKQRLSQTFLF